MFDQGGFDGTRVVVERPVQSPRVSALDETRASAECCAKGAKQVPVAVKTRQVNERRKAGVAVDAELEALVGRNACCALRGNWFSALFGVTHHSSRTTAYFFAKMRFASSNVSFDPMSYHSPGTSQT